MNKLTKFFHELINPHCPHCTEERIKEIEQKELDREINNICKTCEVLKLELGNANNRINQLLDKITIEEKPEPIKQDVQEFKPLQTRHIPWLVKKQMLEEKSRQEMLAKQSAATPDSEFIKEVQTSGNVTGLLEKKNATNS